MSEEEKESVEDQSSTATAQATESETVQEESQESAQDRKKRNDVEYNWAEARRKMQELDRQNREMAEQLAKIQQGNKAQDPQEDEIDRLGEDEIVTKAHVKKLAAKMAREIAQETIKQREAAMVDERLALKFPDYAEIVSKENIELLKQQEPELALSLYHNPDPFAQGVAAYKLLKKIGGNVDMNKVEKEKALKNAQKPVSVNAVTKQSAIGNAHLFENGLTPELKKSLWDEMQACAKRA